MQAEENNISNEKKKNKKEEEKKKQFDEHLEQYLVAALRFDINEYFKRLVTNQVSI